MRIEKIILRQVEMKLKSPFASSAGEEHRRRFVIVETHAGNHIGYGEVAVLSAPFYNEETVGTAWHILDQFLIPIAFQRDWDDPEALAEALGPVRRNYMAKAGLEGAIWDLYAHGRRLALAQVLGGTRERIPVGVSIGIQADIAALIDSVGRYLNAGYQRIKLKIKPGWDETPLRALREAYGTFPMMADANSAYTLNDVEQLRRLDEFQLTMIEQPLAHDDIIEHAQLQRMLQTPICLDESITSTKEAGHALTLGSCRVINIKPGRVGGLTEARRLHDLCLKRAVPVWCGGMFESGIGRAHNIALSSLANFTLPGDISASDRYWEEDLVEPAITIDADGTIQVPADPGLGYTVKQDLLHHLTIEHKTYTNSRS